MENKKLPILDNSNRDTQKLAFKADIGQVQDLDKCPIVIPTEPPFGSYASTARIMAEIMPDFDWDSWKDIMKDGMYDD